MTFAVRPGQVTGFVGPNGAGKSTTMRVILGLDAADAGTALIGGKPYRALRHPLTQVGALLDAAALQPSRSARNHLLWLAHSQGLTAGRVDEVIDQTGLATVIRRKAGGYSLGMRQRLGIAAALLGDPPILMLDEPFGRGRVIADAGVKDLIATVSSDRVRVRTSARAAAIAALAAAGAVVAAEAVVAAAGPDILAIQHLPPDRAVAALTAAGVPFSEVSAHRASLEEAYLELTRNSVEFRAEAAS